MKPKIKKILKLIGVALAAYVIILIGGFFAIKYGLTNTAGVIDKENSYFQKNAKEISTIQRVEAASTTEKQTSVSKIKNLNYCQIAAIGDFYPENAKEILAAYQKTNSDALAAKMIAAVNLRLLGNAVFQKEFTACQTGENKTSYSFDQMENKFSQATGQNVFPWMNRPEWQTIAAATVKDQGAIDKAAAAAGVEPRQIVACMIVEQLRLFNSEREVFKKVFEPLKILGNADQISLGVMGIKQATAEQIENNLKDPSSPYYLGPQYAHLLDYPPGVNVAQARFDRLTDASDNHYYSYLYGALYLREIIHQWKRAGYNIQYRMEILGTLFNVGFPQSEPKADPKVGGSSINVGDGKYSFGSLSYEFYYSGELANEFPYQT